jgi:hypothetical protein
MRLTVTTEIIEPRTNPDGRVVPELYVIDVSSDDGRIHMHVGTSHEHVYADYLAQWKIICDRIQELELTEGAYDESYPCSKWDE